MEPLEPIHPGEVLLKDFLEPLEITSYRLAKDIEVPFTRISEIVKGQRAITADTALRFGRYFNTSAEVWLNLQSMYELRMARKHPERFANIHPSDKVLAA